MSKKYARFICALFCGFLAVFLVAHLVLPDRAFSPQENRNLQQFPKLTLDTVTSGKFMEDFEDYFSEQFAGRDFWIGLKAAAERLSGKQENNGVYFGTDGRTLFAQYAGTPADLDERLSLVDQLADNVEVPVWFSLVPGKNTVLADLLPAGAPKADESGTLAWAASQPASARWIDLTAPLLERKDEYVFYRTDHHWTTLGARYGAEALLTAMGLTPVLPAEEPVQVSDDFYGTTWSSSGAKWVGPDQIHRPTDGSGVTVTCYYTGRPEAGSLYVESKLAEKDKYSYFLGGNQPLCVIETEHTDAPRLLLVRDSYSDSLAPFLTENFSQIHLYDLRYNNMSLKNYVAENDIDQVLVLYSVENFSTDINLFKLGL